MPRQKHIYLLAKIGQLQLIMSLTPTYYEWGTCTQLLLTLLIEPVLYLSHFNPLFLLVFLNEAKNFIQPFHSIQ